MKPVFAFGLLLIAATYTTAAYLGKKENFDADELLEDLENYIAERELADGYPDDDDADDKRMVEILEKLDERSLNLLLSTIDTSDFDGEPAQDSLVKREEKALAYALLLADNPDLREVLGEDEDGRVDVEARKIRGWLKRLVNKVKKLAKAAACRVCNGSRPSFIKSWIWNAFKKLFKKIACKIC